MRSLIFIVFLFALFCKYNNPTGYYAFRDFYPSLSLRTYTATVKECKRLHLDYSLHFALGWVESKYKKGAMSRVGARGDFQVMPVHYKGNPEDLHNTELNARLSTEYFKECLIKRRGDVAFALAGYHAGNNRELTKYKYFRTYPFTIFRLKNTGVSI